MDEDDFLLATHIRYEPGMRDVAFLTSFRDKEEPVARFDLIQLADFLPEFRLLPGYPGHFHADFGVNRANKARAIDAAFIIPARPVRRSSVSTGDLDDLRDFRRG